MAADASRKLQSFNTPRKTPEKTGSTWSTPDRACTHFRERKIRCGREKPQCANCQRDGVACGYYPPGKRVNHIKLLCNNVGNLEDRLCSVERELSRLTTLLRADSHQKNEVIASSGDTSSPQASIPDCPYFEEFTVKTPANHHIVHSGRSHTDRYHGPRTLFVLCKEISNMLPPESSSCSEFPTKDIKSEQASDDEVAKETLNRICLDAGMDEHFYFQADYVPIRLPSKQFLMTVITQFFEQSDYTTDIFVRPYFMARMEQIYSRQFSPTDEVWAICFNAIILLVLGSDCSAQGNNLLFGSQLTQPFLLTIRTALSNPRILMVPALVNVQALALLSLAAQQYYSHGVASSVFAQACVLARIMGLNQLQAVSDTVGSDESLERFKVVRSLFLRDKCLSLSRNSVCWLPAVDCTLLFRFDRNSLEDSKYGPRVQLAALQENIYRFLNFECPYKQSAERRKAELARIEKELCQWADTHGIFSSTQCDIDLDLEFLATRISVLWGSSEPNHIRQTLSDARTSCLLLLVFYGKLEQSMVGRYEYPPLSKYLSKSWSDADTAPRKRKRLNTSLDDDARKRSGSCVRSTSFYSLIESFPVPAFFRLMKNTLSKESNTDQVQPDDRFILERVCECYSESASENQEEAYIQKVRRIFTGLLRLVHLLGPSELLQGALTTTQVRSDIHAPMNTPDVLGKQQSLSELPDLSGSSTYLTTTISQDGHSTKFQPTRTPDTTTTGASPVLLTSIESEYLAQWCDPVRQHPLPPLSQQHLGHFSSRKRQQLSEPDASVDGSTDQASLSEYIHTTPIMPF